MSCASPSPPLFACADALRALLDGIEYPPPNSGRTGYIWLSREHIDAARAALAALDSTKVAD